MGSVELEEAHNWGECKENCDLCNAGKKNLSDELAEMRADIAFIKEHIVKATDTIDKVSVEVMPTVNALMDHPMFKMFAGKKK